MEILNLHQWMEHLEKKLFLFFVVFLSTFSLYLNSRWVLCLTLCCVGFVIGKQEFIISLLGVFLGCFISQDYTTMIYICLFMLILMGMIPFYSIKTRSISYLSFFYSLGVCLFFIKVPINQAVILGAICFYITHVLIKHTSLFVHTKETYTKDELYCIGILLWICILPFFQISPIFYMIWLRFLVMGIMYITDFETGYHLALSTSIFILIHDDTMMEAVVLFLLPLSLIHLYKPKTKFALGIGYVFNHLLMPFLSASSMKPYVFEVVFSSLSFMMIPPSLQLFCDKENNENKQNTQLVNGQKKVMRQLETYSDLFYKIAKSFTDTPIDTSVICYVGAIQNHLCHQCINVNECFNKQKGDHRLIKLMKKGIIEGLNKEEQHYVECYCLHMAQYKKRMNEQYKLYHHQKEMNDQYQVLKNHLYDQLSLVGHLLKNYAKNIEWKDMQSEQYLKELLEAYHYKVWYIEKEDLSLQTFRLELGMTEVVRKEVDEVIIPILEKVMDTKLYVSKLENNGSQLGYTHLILSNHFHYELVYSIHQISKEKDYCGDSYMAFQYRSQLIVALSDGMGYGQKAHEESELTLDVFSRLLKSGIPLEDGIQTINALLRIKNRIDMFTTLDILMFDSSIGEATFIKNGAMPSYIYRNNELITIQPDTLPIGIVDDIKVYKHTIALHEDDYLIMCSDGFAQGIESSIVEVLSTSSHEVCQMIGNEIMKKMEALQLVDDDATIIVLKMRKV